MEINSVCCDQVHLILAGLAHEAIRVNVRELEGLGVHANLATLARSNDAPRVVVLGPGEGLGCM